MQILIRLCHACAGSVVETASLRAQISELAVPDSKSIRKADKDAGRSHPLEED